MSDRLLSHRLRKLSKTEIIGTKPYRVSEFLPRSEYQVTECGRDLYPQLIALLNWGDEYTTDTAGPAISALYEVCGAPARAIVRCDNRHDLGSVSESTVAPEPGIRYLEHF